ncbi:MAG: hypothetical protein LAT81_14080 [Oceanicaulis sp.]|nr:hypothetical protein [Oceanicaulis sp.]
MPDNRVQAGDHTPRAVQQPARLTQRRATELTLAALVAGGALFATFVTDASTQSLQSGRSADSPVPRDRPTPAFDPAEFARTDASAGSRAAVAAALAGQGPALRLAAAPDITRHGEEAEAGALALTPELTVRARPAAASSGSATSPDSGWSGSAFGVQLTATSRELTDLPPVFLVGGAGRESYMIAPGGPLRYPLPPAGVEASVGDAHFGVGVELGSDVYATLGYVREQRRYRAGVREWKEEEHYAGVALRARW